MPKKSKPETWTVARIAKALDVSEATIYNAVRRRRVQKDDPLRPLYVLAKRNGFTPDTATFVITLFRNGGLPAIRTMKKSHNFELTERGRFAHLAFSTTEDEAVIKAIADHQKRLKK